MVMLCLLAAGCVSIVLAALIGMAGAPPPAVQAQLWQQFHTAGAAQFWHAFQAEVLQELSRSPHLPPSPAGPPDPASEVPPLYLYHGTHRRNLASIYARGIEGRTHGWAFAARDYQTAQSYGRKWGGEYAVFRILAQQAYQNGIRFESRSSYFTAQHIHPDFIDFHWTLADLANLHNAAV